MQCEADWACKPFLSRIENGHPAVAGVEAVAVPVYGRLVNHLVPASRKPCPMTRPVLRWLSVAALLMLVGCMSYMGDPAGSNISLGATLNGASEVPPNASTAGGYLTAQYSTSTHIFKWRLVVNALSSPITRA